MCAEVQNVGANDIGQKGMEPGSHTGFNDPKEDTDCVGAGSVWRLPQGSP